MLEICTSTIYSVRAAKEGGAQRVELCSALGEGGVTPSVGLIREARKIDGLCLHVLIRPREGDFLYTEEEVRVMEEDIRIADSLGVDGIVIGALTPEGDVDIPVCHRLVAAAGDMSITFHRAFDMCSDPFRALEEIISLGCHRVLTSGQAQSAEAGIPLLKALNVQSAGRIIIMPGAGVSPKNASLILSATGATEIHASARSLCPSNMIYRNLNATMGTPDSDEYSRLETDASIVKAIVDSISVL